LGLTAQPEFMMGNTIKSEDWLAEEFSSQVMKAVVERSGESLSDAIRDTLHHQTKLAFDSFSLEARKTYKEFSGKAEQQHKDLSAQFLAIAQKVASELQAHRDSSDAARRAEALQAPVKHQIAAESENAIARKVVEILNQSKKVDGSPAPEGKAAIATAGTSAGLVEKKDVPEAIATGLRRPVAIYASVVLSFLIGALAGWVVHKYSTAEPQSAQPPNSPPAKPDPVGAEGESAPPTGPAKRPSVLPPQTAATNAPPAEDTALLKLAAVQLEYPACGEVMTIAACLTKKHESIKPATFQTYAALNEFFLTPKNDLAKREVASALLQAAAKQLATPDYKVKVDGIWGSGSVKTFGTVLCFKEGVKPVLTASASTPVLTEALKAVIAQCAAKFQ
jgi:hypothetical protein